MLRRSGMSSLQEPAPNGGATCSRPSRAGSSRLRTDGRAIEANFVVRFLIYYRGASGTPGFGAHVRTSTQPGGSGPEATPAQPALLRRGLLAALHHLFHISVDGVDHLRVRIRLAIDNDFVEALLGALDVDRVSLVVAVPPAAVPGAEEVGVIRGGAGELGAGQRPHVEIAFRIQIGRQRDLSLGRRRGRDHRGRYDQS